MATGEVLLRHIFLHSVWVACSHPLISGTQAHRCHIGRLRSYSTFYNCPLVEQHRIDTL
ncbi:uncharacterized protein METZ01_LOCUS53633 [marine metagenome]|uniref:Uncharacterized protein n=1 Tax=marine metagenome TaxID=408172 RepID=A0A381SBA3_9ZZZZ